MATMNRINRLVEAYSKCLDRVSIKVIRYKAKLAKLEFWARDEIGPLYMELKKAKDKLEDAIATSGDLFVKPRTQTAHNIKFGVQQSKTTLTWDNEEELLIAIKKKFPTLISTLIKREEKPVVNALMQLPKSDLKRLPLKVVEGEDYVVVKPADNEIEKLIKVYTNGK